jgi:hypothetical protein
MPTAKGWSSPFDEPIPLPDGGELRTLLDAGRYVDALPRSMHEREEWQAVMEVLLSAVEGREPVRLAQVALTLPCRKANNEGSRGGQKWGRRTIMWQAATANPMKEAANLGGLTFLVLLAQYVGRAFGRQGSQSLL